MENPDIIAPLKMKQVNICMEAKPKFMMIGDCWDDMIVAVHDHQLVEWCTPSHLVVGSSKSVKQCEKEETKLKMVQLAEKMNKGATQRAQEEINATQQVENQTGEKKRSSDKGARSSSPETEAEMDEKIEQHIVDLHMTLDFIKHLREQEKVWPQKKPKAGKMSVDLINLTEGDLHDIRDKVRDVTVEVL